MRDGNIVLRVCILPRDVLLCKVKVRGNFLIRSQVKKGKMLFYEFIRALPKHYRRQSYDSWTLHIVS